MEIQIIDPSLKEFYNTKKNYGSDSGFDLYVPETIIFKPGETKFVDLKIKAKYNSGYYLYPRSSISKTPLSMCNSVGIIDKDYRGNIMIALRYNINDTILQKSNELVYDYINNTEQTQTDFNKMFREYYQLLPTFTLEKGTRIAQLVLPSLEPFQVSFVDELDKTERGEGGFGSTGK